MHARACWQGQIREPSGKRIHYEKVADGIGPVDPDEIMKGFEVERCEYVLLAQKEIEGVKLESKLELTRFVDIGDIDAIYYEKPYYVVLADDLAQEAFIALRQALHRAKKIGLRHLAPRGYEYVVSLTTLGRGMALETLRYADEVNRAASYFPQHWRRKAGRGSDLAATQFEMKIGTIALHASCRSFTAIAMTAPSMHRERAFQASSPILRAAPCGSFFVRRPRLAAR